MEITDNERAYEKMRSDIMDIEALRKFEPFTRYFIRRLREKHAAVVARLHDDPVEKCSHEEREILRRLMKEYEDIIGMMAREETTCKATLTLAALGPLAK
jgi:hypothetical protein